MNRNCPVFPHAANRNYPALLVAVNRNCPAFPRVATRNHPAEVDLGAGEWIGAREGPDRGRQSLAHCGVDSPYPGAAWWCGLWFLRACVEAGPAHSSHHLLLALRQCSTRGASGPSPSRSPFWPSVAQALGRAARPGGWAPQHRSSIQALSCGRDGLHDEPVRQTNSLALVEERAVEMTGSTAGCPVPHLHIVTDVGCAPDSIRRVPPSRYR